MADAAIGIRRDETLKGRRAPYPGLVVRINPDAFDGKHIGYEDRVRAAIKGEHGERSPSSRACRRCRTGSTLTPEEEKMWQTVEVKYFFYHSKVDSHVAAHRAEFASPHWVAQPSPCGPCEDLRAPRVDLTTPKFASGAAARARGTFRDRRRRHTARVVLYY